MDRMKEYAELKKAELKERIAQMERPPQLLIYQVGNVEASNRYIRNKIKDCDEVGILTTHMVCAEDITTQELVEEISKRGWLYDAIIVQQPLPPHIDQRPQKESLITLNGAILIKMVNYVEIVSVKTKVQLMYLQFQEELDC